MLTRHKKPIAVETWFLRPYVEQGFLSDIDMHVLDKVLQTETTAEAAWNRVKPPYC